MSAAPQRLVAAVDIGTTAVKAIVAEGTGDARNPGARILGVGMERCAGVRRGVVRDIEETTRAIRKAMRDAERMAGVEVGAVPRATRRLGSPPSIHADPSLGAPP